MSELLALKIDPDGWLHSTETGQLIITYTFSINCQEHRASGFSYLLHTSSIVEPTFPILYYLYSAITGDEG